MNETETAWLAGLVEGEGFISINTKKRYIMLGINMCDLDVLEKARTITRMGNITERKVYKENHSRSWGWRVTSNTEVRTPLVAIRPHMCSRRTERIDEALATPVRVRHPRIKRVRTPEVEQAIWERFSSGLNLSQIARELGISRSTVQRTTDEIGRA